jgi:alkylhydroperoxidase/carboxymuconolactone decarboxylase family protein YurZ
MAQESQPRVYQRMKQEIPGLVAALDNIGDMVRQAGPLDEKSIQLIQLAAAAGIRSEVAVQGHVRRALEAGASPAEIRHALLCLTGPLGFPTASAALNWADDELEPATGGAPLRK